MSEEKDIYWWCTQHKLHTRPGFLCYMYDVAPGVDAKNTPAKEMRCENCRFCHKEVDRDDCGEYKNKQDDGIYADSDRLPPCRVRDDIPDFYRK